MVLGSLRIVCVAAVLAAAPHGCTEAVEADGMLTLRYTSASIAWSVAIPAVLAAGCLAAAVRARRGWRVLFIAAGLFVLAIGILACTTIVRDRVHFSGEGLWQHTGFWFSPTVKGFDLESTQSIELRQLEVRSGRGYEWKDHWFITRRDGTVRIVNPGDLWEWNTPLLVERLEARGIPVADNRSSSAGR